MRDGAHRRNRNMDLSLSDAGLLVSVFELAMAFNVKFGSWNSARALAHMLQLTHCQAGASVSGSGSGP